MDKEVQIINDAIHVILFFEALKIILLCHNKGCDVNVAQGMLLVNGFHFVLNFNGAPLFHIGRTPVMFRDLQITFRLI